MILLLLSILILFCSILIFFDVALPFLWKVTIAATEFGHFFVMIPVMIAYTSGFGDAISAMTTVVSLLSAALLLGPACLALYRAPIVSREITIVFGGKNNEPATPFSLMRLWFGSRVPSATKEIIPYAVHNGMELNLHFFRSATQQMSPCVIVIHTGGWDSGSPKEFETMNHYLASQGYAVAAIQYRFAPHYQWPAQKDDTLAAIGFLKQHAERFGIDPHRFILFGRSAGGQIAGATAYSMHDPAIKGYIGFYAPADLIFAYEHLSPEPDILDSRTLLHNFLGGTLEERSAVYADASSYHHISAATPPTLLIHGTKDTLTWYRQSERLSAVLTERGVPNLYLELPWDTHAFDFNFDGPGGQVSRYAVMQFLSFCTKTH
jgi:acetyl esterase/lipase